MVTRPPAGKRTEGFEARICGDKGAGGPGQRGGAILGTPRVTSEIRRLQQMRTRVTARFLQPATRYLAVQRLNIGDLEEEQEPLVEIVCRYLETRCKTRANVARKKRPIAPIGCSHVILAWRIGHRRGAPV